MPFGAAVRIALAADTVSILVMEIVDNGILLIWPSAMEATVADPLFWGSLAIALAIAFVVTVPVNRAMIARGLGHAKAHAAHSGHAGHSAGHASMPNTTNLERLVVSACESALAGRRWRDGPRLRVYGRDGRCPPRITT